jgi:hypothetical protein
MGMKREVRGGLVRFQWECGECGATGAALTIGAAEKQRGAHEFTHLQQTFDDLIADGLIRPNGVIRNGQPVYVATDRPYFERSPAKGKDRSRPD